MENLNAEQIVDILDKMDFFQGQRAGRELWNEKPFDVQEQDIADFSRDVALIKRYIKELTEENERISQSLANSKSILANSKADTVRKMQERLKKAFDHRGLVGVDIIEQRIDQIAKEMLEGEK